MPLLVWFIREQVDCVFLHSFPFPVCSLRGWCVQGRFFNEKAREADEKSAQMFLETR